MTNTGSSRVSNRSIFFVLIASVGAFYLATLAPTVLWGDDAFFQRTAFENNLQPDGGGHWLWLTIAHWFIQIPFWEVAYKANMVSALAGTATIGILFFTARALQLSTTASLVATISLAVSHTFWMHAVRAEVYTVFTGLMALELFLLFRWTKQRKWPVFLAAALWGITLLGHQMAVLLLPSFIYLFWRRRKWLSTRTRLLTIALFIVGILPVFVIVQWQVHEPNIVQSLRLYFTHSGADFSHAIFAYSIGSFSRDSVLWLAYLALQFPSPAVLLILVTIGTFRKWIATDKWQAVALLYVTSVAFAFSYRVNDQFVFFLPSYLALSLLIGLGWDTAFLRWSWLRSETVQILFVALIAISPPLVYRGISTAFLKLNINPLRIRELPGREPNHYFLWPAKKWLHRS